MPAIYGRELPSRPLFAETADAVAVRGPRHKLIRRVSEGHEFYDLGLDPGEAEPLAGPCQKECAALLAELRRYLEKVSQSAATGAGKTVPLGPQEVRDLLRLGYLGNGD